MFKISLLLTIRLTLACALFIPDAFANPLISKGQTIFSCDTDNGKRIVLSSVVETIAKDQVSRENTFGKRSRWRYFRHYAH